MILLQKTCHPDRMTIFLQSHNPRSKESRHRGGAQDYEHHFQSVFTVDVGQALPFTRACSKR
jgi:hypothetical protein